MTTTSRHHRHQTIGFIVALLAATACGPATGAERDAEPSSTMEPPATAAPTTEAPRAPVPATTAPGEEHGGVPGLADLGAVVTTFAQPPSPLAEAGVQDALTELTASGDALSERLASGLEQREDSDSGGSAVTTAGFRASFRAAPTETAEDDPNVERETKTETVTLPSGTELVSTITSELRLTERVMSLNSTQNVDATGQGQSAEVAAGNEATLDACPTAEGKVSGTVVRRTTVTETVNGTTTTIALELQADVAGTVGSDRKPIGFSLSNVEFTTNVVSVVDGVASTRSLQGSGQVDGIGNDVVDLGTAQIQFASEDDELSAGSDRLFRVAMFDAALSVRLLLASLHGVSSGGLCVELRADTHGVTFLPPGGSTTIDLTVVDTATGQAVDLPVDGVSMGGSLTPQILEHTPGTMSFTAPTDEEAPYKVYLSTDGVRGGHTIEVVFGEEPGWKVDTTVDVFTVTGVKCNGHVGEWTLALSANFEGAAFSGQVTANIDTTTNSGAYVLTGQTVGGGIVVNQTGTGTLSYVYDGEDQAHLTIEGTAWTSGGSGGGIQGGGVITLTRATPADCPPS